MKFMGELRSYCKINRTFRGREITKTAVKEGQGYLRPRIEQEKLVEIERSLAERSKKQQSDHFFLMGRDDKNEPSRILEFDNKMMKMRETGFSPHKKAGFLVRGRKGDNAEALGKGRTKKADQEERDFKEGRRKVEERAAKIMLEEAQNGDITHDDDATFDEQMDALLSIVEMGKIKA